MELCITVQIIHETKRRLMHSKVFGKIDTPVFSVMIEVRTIVEFLSLKLHFSAGFLPKSYDFFSRCMSHLQTELLHISPTVQTGFFQDFSDFLYF